MKSAKASLDKLTAEKEGKEITAQEQAEKESKAIDAVEIELITMLQDPELRKRYFSVVEMEELEENEFNLNIPRYVDTFEPEEEINLAQAIEEFKTVLKTEENIHQKLQNLLVF